MRHRKALSRWIYYPSELIDWWADWGGVWIWSKTVEAFGGNSLYLVRWQIWRTLLRQMFIERDWSGEDLLGTLGKVFLTWQAIFTAISSLEWDTERHWAGGYTIPLSRLTVWPELLAGLCCGGIFEAIACIWWGDRFGGLYWGKCLLSVIGAERIYWAH